MDGQISKLRMDMFYLFFLYTKIFPFYFVLTKARSIEDYYFVIKLGIPQFVHRLHFHSTLKLITFHGEHILILLSEMN